MQDFTLGTCQAMTFEEWALSQLLMICRPDGYLDQTKDGIHSTYLVEKVRALVLALDHGDELEYDLQMAMLDGNECEINRILADMRYRDADGAGYTA